MSARLWILFVYCFLLILIDEKVICKNTTITLAEPESVHSLGLSAKKLQFRLLSLNMSSQFKFMHSVIKKYGMKISFYNNSCEKILRSVKFTHYAFKPRIVKYVEHEHPYASRESSLLTSILNQMHITLRNNFNTREQLSASFIRYWYALEYFHSTLDRFYRLSLISNNSESFIFQDALMTLSLLPDNFYQVSQIIEKYGVLPESVYPASVASMDKHSYIIMTHLLKSGIAKIFEECQKWKYDPDVLQARISTIRDKYMKKIQKLLNIFFSPPPIKFTWTFYSELDNSRSSYNDISAIAFYQDLIKPHFDISKWIVLVSDNRYPYNRKYRIKHGAACIEDSDIYVYNLPIDDLLTKMQSSIKYNISTIANIYLPLYDESYLDESALTSFLRSSIGDNYNLTYRSSPVNVDYSVNRLVYAMRFIDTDDTDRNLASHFKLDLLIDKPQTRQFKGVASRDYLRKYIRKAFVCSCILPNEILEFPLSDKEISLWDKLA
ncbi:hypothetical protein GJ496_008485 [Pomphorhynchus laevis]|nr:hypothetical protein GJ496_008485 [Pomphorhynchus laevis]